MQSGQPDPEHLMLVEVQSLQDKNVHVFSLRIPRHEWLKYYYGEANKVFVRTGKGVLISLPARHFRPFTNYTGVQGYFVMELTKENKLLSLKRLP